MKSIVTASMAAGLFFALLAVLPIQGESLHSQECVLTVSANSTSDSVRIRMPAMSGASADFVATEPIRIEVVEISGATNWLTAGYSSVLKDHANLQCAGRIQSRSGTIFDFTDIYSAGDQPRTFVMRRQLRIEDPSTNDVGFLSLFRIKSSSPAPLREQEIFVPGVWYLDNKHAPAYALGANPLDNVFLIREDRMALPLIMMRNHHTGITIALTHLAPDGATSRADYKPGRVIDEKIQVASIGVWSHEDPAVCFCFPANEGERTYISAGNERRRAPDRKGWAERFHPVKRGVKHSYEIMIRVGQTQDFPTAMREAWRSAYEEMPPAVIQTDVSACYDASMKLIKDWSRTYNGCPGLPFRLRLPKGELEGNEHLNFQMGFVGQQLPLAYHLLRFGLLHSDEESIRKGEAMVDFWASNSLTSDGLPRTWYNAYPQPHWREYNTFMRVASDGMEGALRAWDVMQAFHRPKSEWLKFCRGFGDWLVRHQNEDGSWYREYTWDSQPANRGEENTTHPVRYLVDLAKVTGETIYLNAALRAGAYSYTNIDQEFAYIGGTVDNPNVLDKEAGFIALQAFLALHDALGEKRWLQAAIRAADFTETWIYCWNVPIPADDPLVTYPKGCATTGFSLIATGQSGADLFMAGAPFLYYRLFLETGDRHYTEIARQLLYNTKQGMDIDGSLGYGHTGLCTEALSLAPPRGHGVGTWLPWLTYSMIDPLVELQDIVGIMEAPRSPEIPLAELRQRDTNFAKSQGFLTVGNRK